MLREGEEIWPEVQEEMTRSLATMRVDYDQVNINEIHFWKWRLIRFFFVLQIFTDAYKGIG